MSDSDFNISQELSNFFAATKDSAQTATTLNFVPMSKEYNLFGLLLGHINGLLALEELTPEQVTLLALLLDYLIKVQ